MFSKPWTIREEGLQECEEYIKKNGNTLAVFQGALSAAGQAMSDKIAQITNRSLSIVQTTLKACTTQLEPGSGSVVAFN